jgi:hypothetical protein
MTTKNNHPADRFVEQIVAMKNTWRENRSDENHTALVAYLAQNHDELKALVDSVYARLDKSQRETLQKEHRELDGSVVTDSFHTIADAALVTAKEWADPQNKTVRYLFTLNDDSVEMLLRALRYAKYIE